MNSYLPKLTPQGDVKPVFNPLDFTWIYGYASYADLLNYANVYSSNVFYSPNSFTTITFNEGINDISPTVLSYLKNVNMDIQDQFTDDRLRLNTLETKTTNQSFTNNTTSFSGSLSTPVFILNNANLNTRLTTIETNVSTLTTKATNINYNNAINTTFISGVLNTPSIVLNGTDVNTRITNNENDIDLIQNDIEGLTTSINTAEDNIVINTNDINNLKPRMTTAETNINNLSNQLNTLSNVYLDEKADDNQVVHLTGNETIDGLKSFVQTPLIGVKTIATTDDITTAINGLIGSAGTAYDTLSEIQTILQGNAGDINTILSSMVNLTGTQTISGIKTFSSLITGSSLNIVGNSTLGTNNTNTLTIRATTNISSPISFTSTLNNISTTTFGYLTGVSSNIQTQFNNFTTRLTNYTYHSDTSTQTITTNTAIQDTLTTNNITNNNLWNDTITTNSIFATSIICKSFKCIDLPESLNIPVVYITNIGVQYPIMKSGLIGNLTGLDLSQPLYITIAPNYQLVFFNSDRLALARLYNPTGDFLYNVGITFNTVIPYEYKISLL